MRFEYLDRVDFARALERQSELHADAVRNEAYDTILGFEPKHAVITLGKRAVAEGAEAPEGFQVFALDRGGQATIHNPGQLVIFPVVTVSSVREFVQMLWQVTEITLAEFGCPAKWDEHCPGLYTPNGKVVSLGVRVKGGVSTHGLAINVANRLEDFQRIAACGVRNAKMDRVGADIRLRDVFVRWCENFARAQLTSSPKIANLVEPTVRS
jgi:lipoyl(octanoyl) transferase